MGPRFRLPSVRKAVREERGDDGFQAVQSPQERGDGGLPGPAPDRPGLGVADGQVALGPCDADEKEAPLFFDVPAGLAAFNLPGFLHRRLIGEPEGDGSSTKYILTHIPDHGFHRNI